jgi:hypothetical protein
MVVTKDANLDEKRSCRNGQVEKHKIVFGTSKGERTFRRPRTGLNCDINVVL